MNKTCRTPARLAPRRQGHWDWRAAANFVCGGAGGGLLLGSALAAPFVGDVRVLLWAGLALIGCGLFCVWLEIGRPWRALNVFRHIASSWMTREASVAPLLFASGALALASGEMLAVATTGLLGFAFVYAQARILAADKGIPAWRHPLCAPLVMVTGLAEGAGLLAVASLAMPALLPASAMLAVLAVLRIVAWNRYLDGLARAGAPAGALKTLGALDKRFVWFGNALPALLGVLAALAGLPALAAVAGLVAVLAGMHFKYTLVCRAAYTQGFALPQLPVRGRGPAAAGIRPGWIVG